MNPVNYLRWHWQFGGTHPIDNPSCGQTEEIMPTLHVPSGTHCQCPHCSGTHGVVMLLMSLNVFPIFVFAMAVEVNRLSCHDGPGTQVLRHTILWWKGVSPEHGVLHHFNQHASRNSFERDRIMKASHSLFDGSDVSLNVALVFIAASGVQSHTPL